MATNAILNRVQILFYSILISIMSGVNRMRSYPEPQMKTPAQPLVMEIENSTRLSDKTPGMTVLDYVKYTQQALSSILVWIILGFATGFLAGLINFR